MRIFLGQVNPLKTTPILEQGTETPLTTLVITVKVLDGVTELASITMTHTSGGVYTGTLPKIDTLVDQKDYTVEVTVTSGGTPVWYFKGPVKGLLRKTQ